MSSQHAPILKALHEDSLRVPVDKELILFTLKVIANVEPTAPLTDLRKMGNSLAILEKNLEGYDLCLDSPAKVYVLFLYDDLVAIQMFALYLNWYAGAIAKPGLFNDAPITIGMLERTVFQNGLLLTKEQLHKAYDEIQALKIKK